MNLLFCSTISENALDALQYNFKKLNEKTDADTYLHDVKKYNLMYKGVTEKFQNHRTAGIKISQK